MSDVTFYATQFRSAWYVTCSVNNISKEHRSKQQKLQNSWNTANCPFL